MTPNEMLPYLELAELAQEHKTRGNVIKSEQLQSTFNKEDLLEERKHKKNTDSNELFDTKVVVSDYIFIYIPCSESKSRTNHKKNNLRLKFLVQKT